VIIIHIEKYILYIFYYDTCAQECQIATFGNTRPILFEHLTVYLLHLHLKKKLN